MNRTPSVQGAKTWVNIHADALRHNIQHLRSFLEPGVHFCAVVKANAYGHDLETIVRLASLENVRHFAVDSIDEAHRVKTRAPDAEIFILGYTVPERVEEVILNNYIQTVYDKHMVTLFAGTALKLQTRARLNLKVETGTQRQGIAGNDLEAFLHIFQQEARNVELTGVSSHFANAEAARDPSFTQKQTEVFARFVAAIKHAGFDPTYKHIACTAAGILYPSSHFNMVRFGIGLYGLWSDDSVRLRNRASANPIDMRPVMSWKTRIAQIKNVPAHAPIGYGCSFVPKHPMRIAVLPLGYYDGYKRVFKNQAFVLIKGQKCPVIGTICMNMCMVDVSHLPSLEIDTPVTILGQDGMHRITAEDLAQWAGTINYEIVTHVGAHLPRNVT